MGNGPWLINVKGDGVGATVEGKEEEVEGVKEAVLSMLGIGGDDIFLCDITARVITESFPHLDGLLAL
jgi:hypothetical protein